MKVILRKMIGDLDITVEVEGKNEKEIFPQLEFWSALPTKHPSGATDFQFAVRPATTGAGKSVKYYELICPSADQRFQFGQATDEAGGGLFPKGWDNIYHSGDDRRHDSRPENENPRPQPTKQAASSMDSYIRAEFQRLGISNLGQEKGAVMAALGSRVGQAVAELAETEKISLLKWLKQQDRRAA